MTTKQLFGFIILIISTFYLTSCDEWYDERIDGNGTVVELERSISSFNELISIGNFDVYLTMADSTSLRIEAEENLLPYIITKVSGDKFYVEVKDRYSLDNNEPMNIYLTTPNLEEAILAGSGKIECDSITSNYLDLKITGSGRIDFDNVDVQDLGLEIAGSGDILLTGLADNGDFEITGSGSIRSLDLIQEECEARIVGSGNMYILVNDYLKAVITGSGNIYYAGHPIVDEYISGTGDVRRY